MRPVESPPPAAEREATTATLDAGRKPRLRWLRSVPGACWACMAIATVNALAWAVLTPAFQTPDEPVHAGYVQYLGETGRVPQPSDPPSAYTAPPDARTLFERVPWSLTKDPSWSKANDREVDRFYETDPSSEPEESAAAYAAANPPLYYTIETVPYTAAKGGTFVDRLFAMRFLSALLAGLTTGFVFLFLRELLPAVPWAWTVGALAVAFQPTFGFIGGGVNNDNLLWVASAALFWLLARVFRRGLTAGLAAGIGAALAVGLLAKGSMAGLVPGLLVGFAVLVWRSPRPFRGRSLRNAGIGLGVGILPFLAWLGAARLLWERPPRANTGGFENAADTSLSGQLSYMWQFYFPRLPFMNDWFEDSYPSFPLWDTYFEAFVGRFGWFYFGFPDWVNWVGLVLAAGILGLAGRALLRFRPALRRRSGELITYALMAGGMLVLVNVLGYRYLLQTGTDFEQVRYLFPILPLYAALVALAVRAPKRLGPALGAVFIAIAAAHSLYAHFVLVAHYYN
jgi:4-amino-4-deoxy-L-arabinose transferase-like glycosyltransferase